MLHVRGPKLRLTLTASRATAPTLMLRGRGRVLASWHVRAKKGKNAFVLALPKARKPGRGTLRVAEPGNPRTRTLAVTFLA